MPAGLCKEKCLRIVFDTFYQRCSSDDAGLESEMKDTCVEAAHLAVEALFQASEEECAKRKGRSGKSNWHSLTNKQKDTETKSKTKGNAAEVRKSKTRVAAKGGRSHEAAASSSKKQRQHGAERSRSSRPGLPL